MLLLNRLEMKQIEIIATTLWYDNSDTINASIIWGINYIVITAGIESITDFNFG